MSLDKARYVPWYKIAEEVLGRRLIKHAETDEDVIKWVSDEGWLLIPLPYESDLKQARSRPFPNIFLWLHEDRTLTLGLVANTIPSMEKMKNILLPHQDVQRQSLISGMRKLDPKFKTYLSAKKKDYWAAPPTYDSDPSIESNKINGQSIVQTFAKADAILEKGRQVPALHSPNYPSMTPILDLATGEFSQDKREFARRLSELKPLLEICLEVKTKAEHEKEEKKKPKKRIEDYECSKCTQKFTRDQYDENRFCPKRGMRIRISIRYV